MTWLVLGIALMAGFGLAMMLNAAINAVAAR